MIRPHSALLAAAIALAGVHGAANAAPITLNAGDTAIFNFAGATQAGAVRMHVSGFAANQGVTGSISLFSEANLGGVLVYVDNDLDGYSSSESRSESNLLDGSSILISITSGSFVIDPNVTYMDAADDLPKGRSDGVAGTDSRNTTSPPSVPEPGSLLLVALAGLALGAMRRRSSAV